MSFESALVEGVANLLQDKGIAVWRPNGVYAATDVAIFNRAVPDSPHSLVTLSTYPIADKAALATSTVALQVRTRFAGRDPRLVDTLADAIFAVLQGLTQQRLGGVVVVQCNRQSGVSLGQDGQGRWSRTDNYYLDTFHPTENRS